MLGLKKDSFYRIYDLSLHPAPTKYPLIGPYSKISKGDTTNVNKTFQFNLSPTVGAKNVF